VTSEAQRSEASASTDLLAWSVEIDSMSCIVFAATRSKAQWIAVKGYRDAGFGRPGEWPRAKAVRAERYDASALRDQGPRGWTEEYVSGYTSR